MNTHFIFRSKSNLRAYSTVWRSINIASDSRKHWIGWSEHEALIAVRKQTLTGKILRRRYNLYTIRIVWKKFLERIRNTFVKQFGIEGTLRTIGNRGERKRISGAVIKKFCFSFPQVGPIKIAVVFLFSLRFLKIGKRCFEKNYHKHKMVISELLGQLQVFSRTWNLILD